MKRANEPKRLHWRVQCFSFLIPLYLHCHCLLFGPEKERITLRKTHTWQKINWWVFEKQKNKFDSTVSGDFSFWVFQKIPAISPPFSWTKADGSTCSWPNGNKNGTTALWEFTIMNSVIIKLLNQCSFADCSWNFPHVAKPSGSSKYSLRLMSKHGLAHSKCDNQIFFQV